MDRITICGSITLEISKLNRNYTWKSNPKKTSNYKVISKRAFVRFSSEKFSSEINKLQLEKRKINVDFIDMDNLEISRNIKGSLTIQGYSGKHSYTQFVINKILPKEIKKAYLEKTRTIPVNITLNLDEWRDMGIVPSDFMIQVEKYAKTLMNKALNKRFTVNKVSKGREFDISMSNPNNKKLIIGLSSHVAKNKSRSKEKTVQKILMDISKMLPYLYENKKSVPVIITRPIVFENSWSFTTQRYLDFYKRKFGFIFLTTEFKKGWENDIIKELSKI